MKTECCFGIQFGFKGFVFIGGGVQHLSDGVVVRRRF